MPQELTDRPQRPEKKRMHVVKFSFGRFLETLVIETPSQLGCAATVSRNNAASSRITLYKKATCSNKGHNEDLTLAPAPSISENRPHHWVVLWCLDRN